MLKTPLLLICSLFCSLLLQAQDKPLKKYSKKELIALVEQQNKELSKQTTEIKSLNTALEAGLNKAEEWELRAGALSSDLTAKEAAYAKLDSGYNELILKYEKLRAEPPKEIEVLDLYSFGYQPYQYNERQYQLFLDETRAEVIKTRMGNVRDLVLCLQSHKIDDEIKKSLYFGFVITYKGYLDGISQERLTYYNEALNTEIQKGITQKTYKELDQISKENRWIQLLERY